MQLAIVIPVYNEAGVIEDVIRELDAKIISKLPRARLIVAEDGSDDGTKEILARLGREISFDYVEGDARKGYTRAFKDALTTADAEWIFFCDSDGQHDPDDLFKLIEHADQYDIISGYKAPRRDPAHRVVLSRGYNGLIGLLFGLWMRDIDSGFKLIRRSVVEAVLAEVSEMKHCVMSEFILLAHLRGFRIFEVPIRHFPRKTGTTAIFHPAELPGIVGGLVVSLLKIRQKSAPRR